MPVHPAARESPMQSPTHSVDGLCITASATLAHALERMDAGARNILLLVGDDGRFRRTVTDGDLRRLLLARVGFDTPIGGVLATIDSHVVSPDTPVDAVHALMQRHAIDHVPAIDAHGRPVGLHRRRDLAKPILLSTPHLGELEREFVTEAFDTNWIAPVGPHIDAFEREFAQLVNVPAACALSSGTAAIHLGLQLLGVGPGDVVLCSSLTFVASANPITYLGAEPHFIDSDRATWNMSPRALACAIEELRARGRTPKAIVVVSLYGQSADMDPIVAICREHGIAILEDAAEALGADYRGRASGTIGDLGIYSFNGNKIITTSGGGMLVGHDPSLIERARFLATQAREPVAHYEHRERGFNYRLSNLLAGVGRGQLQVLDDRVRARRAVFERYRAGLTEIDGFTWMPEADFGRSTRWLSACTIDPQRAGFDRDELSRVLAESRIEARPVWKPMHRQPLFASNGYTPHSIDESVSDELFANGLCLPSGSNMTDAEQDRVIDAILDVARKARVGARSVA